MRAALIAIVLTVGTAVVAAAGGCGGEYVDTGRSPGRVDRGEVNGRTFDFVANKPDGDDWTIRVRGTSMFVSYANGDATDKLGGQIELTDKEGRKVWRLVDRLDLPSRKRGKKREAEGYVTMVLRKPPEEKGGEHKITTVYVRRNNDVDDDVTNLAAYLADLVKKYKHETPHF